MDATILQPEHVRTYLCPSVSALWLLLGLYGTRDCTSSIFAFSTVGLNYRHIVSTCMGGNRESERATYFEHNDVYDGHNCCIYVKILR